MLKIVQIPNKYVLEQVYSEINLNHSSWIVSDLRTKIELKNYFLARDGFFVENSVLRVSDLWAELLKRHFPSIKVLNDELIRMRLKYFIQQHPELSIEENGLEALMNVMHSFAFLYLTSKGYDEINEWFEKNPKESLRIKHWYLKGRACFGYLISEEIISEKWISAFLLSQEDIKQQLQWERNLFVDLSGEINLIEAELLKLISSQIEVTVFEPKTNWRSQYFEIDNSYKQFTNLAEEKTKLSKTIQNQKFDFEINDDSKNEIKFDGNTETIKYTNEVKQGAHKAQRKFLKFTGMLSEVKWLICEIRKKLEEGLQPKQISIVASDIEIYWPALRIFLDEEGIPYNKSISTRLQTFPLFQQWLSKLKLISENWETSYFELDLFSDEDSNTIDFDKFKKLFSNIYSEEEIKRSQEVFDKFKKQSQNFLQICSREQFLTSSLMLLPKDWNEEVLQKFLKSFISETNTFKSLKLRDWIQLLEFYIYKTEYKIKESDENGISISSILSSHTQKQKILFFIGLSEEQYKNSSRSAINSTDLNRLSSDLTASKIELNETNYKEFQLLWLTEGFNESIYYSFPLSDFQGSLQAPHQFWVQNSESEVELTICEETMIDYYQSCPNERTNQWEKITQKIGIENGEYERETIHQNKIVDFSVSSIEKYIDCPFKLAAEKVFKLKDQPELDIQINAMSKGSLTHELLEKIIIKLNSIDYKVDHEFSVKIIEEILCDIKIKYKENFINEKYWNSFKSKLQILGLRFVEFEKQWKEKFPESINIATEKALELYYSITEEKFHKEYQPESFSIKGKIDRIDGDHSGHLIVIDYKSSGVEALSHHKWFENSKIQILFYMWAIENGYCSDIKGEVVGGFYYVLKNFSRHKGLQIEDYADHLFPSAGRRKDICDHQTKNKYYDEVTRLISDKIKLISSGVFPPKPNDNSICSDCSWRNLCRATHLN